DSGSVSGLAGGGSRAGGRLQCLGRPALGRSFYAGTTYPLPRPSPNRADAGSADFSPGIYAPPLGYSFLPQPDHTQPVRSSTGRRDGGASDRRQGLASGAGAAGHSQ